MQKLSLLARPSSLALSIQVALFLSVPAFAQSSPSIQTNTEEQAKLVPTAPTVKTLSAINVTGNRPTSIPSYIPTTIETITGQEIAEKINATDAEDALKYFPSLLVRKRYIGDFDHAVLASRASGTGNSARSLVYAD